MNLHTRTKSGSRFPNFIGSMVLLTLIMTTGAPLLGQTERSLELAADTLLSRLVVNGKVDYLRARGMKTELDAFRHLVAEADSSRLLAEGSYTAFLINAYNLLVIARIAGRYPVASVRDIPGFFTDRDMLVCGEKRSLDDIEHLLLQPRLPDPATHFLLVCGAVSCPPLRPQALRGDDLLSTLSSAARAACRDVSFVHVSENAATIRLSRIFRWYEHDFTLNHSSLREYISSWRETPLPGGADIQFMKYDWSLNDAARRNGKKAHAAPRNLQDLTPSTLLDPGRTEVKLFTNLYTQTAYYDNKGEWQETDQRQSWLTFIASGMYGLTPAVNFGVELFITSVRYDQRSSSSLSAFSFSSETGRSRTALNAIVPKVKIAPFRSSSAGYLQPLAFQLSLRIPAAGKLAQGNDVFLAADGVQWWLQALYDIRLGAYALLYTEAALLVGFPDGNTTISSPLKVFLNFYPGDRWTLYIPLELFPVWNTSAQDSASTWSSWSIQTGIGIKYQISRTLESELLATVFPAGRSAGAGRTWNAGVRAVF